MGHVMPDIESVHVSIRSPNNLQRLLGSQLGSGWALSRMIDVLRMSTFRYSVSTVHRLFHAAYLRLVRVEGPVQGQLVPMNACFYVSTLTTRAGALDLNRTGSWGCPWPRRFAPPCRCTYSKHVASAHLGRIQTAVCYVSCHSKESCPWVQDEP